MKQAAKRDKGCCTTGAPFTLWSPSCIGLESWSLCLEPLAFSSCCRKIVSFRHKLASMNNTPGVDACGTNECVLFEICVGCIAKSSFSTSFRFEVQSALDPSQLADSELFLAHISGLVFLPLRAFATRQTRMLRLTGQWPQNLTLIVACQTRRKKKKKGGQRLQSICRCQSLREEALTASLVVPRRERPA